MLSDRQLSTAAMRAEVRIPLHILRRSLRNQLSLVFMTCANHRGEAYFRAATLDGTWRAASTWETSDELIADVQGYVDRKVGRDRYGARWLRLTDVPSTFWPLSPADLAWCQSEHPIEGERELASLLLHHHNHRKDQS